VKAARFEYHAPTSIDEAVGLLASLGDEAKVLGGGQSLVPMLALRLTRFAHLIDLNKITELSYIDARVDELSIGAMTRQASAEHSAEVATAAPLLARAIPHIGHFQIRNRGTVGGSIAHADPASELPTIARVLDAEIEVAGVSGTRRIPVDDFFVSMWETSLGDDEIVVAIHFPAPSAGSGFGFEELALRPGDFALAGSAVALDLDGDGAISHVSIGLLGMDSTPVRAKDAERSLVGQQPEQIDFTETGRLAVAAANPTDDVHASAKYRTNVGAVLVERALASALKEAARG
jgi:carbon-monoxide dehydrogenase medium subunit